MSYISSIIGKNTMYKSRTITFPYSPNYTKLRKTKGLKSFTITTKQGKKVWDLFDKKPVKQSRKAPFPAFDKATEAKLKLRLFM